MCNHDPVINAEALICRKYTSTALTCHDTHHLLQSLIATNTSYNQDILTSNVGHSTLRDFHQHSEHVLL